MKVLITGFTPFGGEQINPSYEAAKLLPNEVNGAQVIKGLLTTAFGQSYREIKALIKAHKPDIVINVGQAGGRDCVSLEKVAINYAQTKGYDKEGVIKGDKILQKGKAAFFSTLPLEEIVLSLTEKRIPAKISLSAGSFVCNYVMYNVLKMTQRDKISSPSGGGAGRVLAGFIHVPYSKEQVKDKRGVFCMEIKQIASALQIAIETTLFFIQSGG